MSVTDTFTEASDTALASHTPDVDTVGGGWTVQSGSFTVIASTDVCEGDGRCFIDSGLADAVVTNDGTLHSGTEAGMGHVLRWQDSSHFWQATMNTTSDLMILQEIDTGVTTRDTDASQSWAPGDTVAFTSTVNGDSIVSSETVTGASLSFTSSLFNTKTIHGMRVFVISETVAGFFDNFNILVADAGGVPPLSYHHRFHNMAG
jgi:hypothetical protein